MFTQSTFYRCYASKFVGDPFRPLGIGCLVQGFHGASHQIQAPSPAEENTPPGLAETDLERNGKSRYITVYD